MKNFLEIFPLFSSERHTKIWLMKINWYNLNTNNLKAAVEVCIFKRSTFRRCMKWTYVNRDSKSLKRRGKVLNLYFWVNREISPQSLFWKCWKTEEVLIKVWFLCFFFQFLIKILGFLKVWQILWSIRFGKKEKGETWKPNECLKYLSPTTQFIMISVFPSLFLKQLKFNFLLHFRAIFLIHKNDLSLLKLSL